MCNETSNISHKKCKLQEKTVNKKLLVACLISLWVYLFLTAFKMGVFPSCSIHFSLISLLRSVIRPKNISREPIGVAFRVS